jgi:hypothetical protein
MSTLYRLVYLSRNRISGGPAAIAAEVQSILAAAQRNNPRLSITGALIFNAGVFAQVLEGPCSNLEVTFEKIQQDPRHGDLEVLAYHQTKERAFDMWSMGYFGQSREGQNLFGHVAQSTGFNPDGLEGARLFEIIRDIALEEEVRAA